MGWTFIAIFADATIKPHDEIAGRNNHHLWAIGTVGEDTSGDEINGCFVSQSSCCKQQT